jgi:uncharacterized membrane protein
VVLFQRIWAEIKFSWVLADGGKASEQVMSTTAISLPSGFTDTQNSVHVAAGRLPSIDIFRELIIVWMAVDHTHDFFTNIPFEPESLAKTNLVLFATRWVTHCCAPMFFFLAGTSAFLYGQRRLRRDLRQFLVTRGLWLIFLEFTVIGTAWTFQFPWGFFGVIWGLGASMLILSLVVALPIRWITMLSIAVMTGHNLLDSIHPKSTSPVCRASEAPACTKNASSRRCS